MTNRFDERKLRIYSKRELTDKDIKMKKLSLIIFSIVTILFGSPSYAQPCGAGTIVEIKEGGWNSDDFMIKLEGPNASAESLFQGFIRFSATSLSATRMESIRRLATTAFALDAKVWTYTHTGSCASATEISILQ